MKKILSGIFAFGLASAVTFTSLAHAAPVFVPRAQTVQPADVIQIRDGWRRGHGRNWRRHGNWHGNGWHDEGLYIGGALIAGALIGGALANRSYYDDGYYDDGYYDRRYYRRDNRRTYRDHPGNYPEGYRYYPDTGQVVVCPPRMEDAGKC